MASKDDGDTDPDNHPTPLTPEQRAVIEAEVADLISKLKSLAERANTGTLRVSAAALATMDAEMDAAFHKNVAKSKADREARRKARKAWETAIVDPQQDDGMTPDNYPSVEDEPLSQIELDAKEHWERFCPNLVKELNDQGPDALDTAIRAAYWRMEYLTRLDHLKNPDLHPLQLEEAHRTELWLRPESHETPSTKGPVVPAHVLKQIDDEMTAAFHKNVAKSRADREARWKK